MGKLDEELMQAYKDGDESSFVTLYERYKYPIYRFVFRRVGHQGRAEELTHEVFFAVIKHRATWQPDATFKTYIYRIAFNRCVSETMRSERKLVVANDDNEDGGPTHEAVDPGTPLDNLEQREMQRHVQEALSRLEPDYRDPILLREFADMSYEEIAGELDIAVGTVKSRIFRGKVELKRILQRMMTGAPARARKTSS